jgi:hypothetical protein
MEIPRIFRILYKSIYLSAIVQKDHLHGSVFQVFPGKSWCASKEAKILNELFQ